MTETPQRLDRPNVPALDAILGEPTQVLDKGFVRLVDYMGDQAAITQAARVSYGQGTRSTREDRSLIRYLLRHRHTTPFEMCEIKLHVKLPVFVARQWIRHRTANVNEYSARYSILDREFYIPADDDIQPQSKSNAQGRDGSFPSDVKRAMVESIRFHSEGAYNVYEELQTGWPWFDSDGDEWQSYSDPEVVEACHANLDLADYNEHPRGMARELARMVLPTNVYTQWYWKVDLHNLLHFLSLRADPHAQKEIRDYANVICGIVETWVPDVWEAFMDYVVEAHTFSRQEMNAIRDMLSQTSFTTACLLPEGQGHTSREFKEFLKALGLGRRESSGREY